MQDFVVIISRLYRSRSGTEQDLPIDFGGAGLDLEEDLGRLLGHIRLVRGDGDILALGALSTSVATACRLCLDPLERPVEVQISGRYLPPEKPEFNPESDFYDPDVFPLIDRSELDLTDLVRQSIITAVKPDIDCGGACAQYAGVLASYNSGPDQDEIDPRLAPLQDMKARLLESGELSRDKEEQ
jgi:uncharacterized metal-binding protein YceD (DUF177 family)